MILLDTCTFLWLAGDQSKLSDVAKARLVEQASGLFVSSITAFEVGLLVSKNRIRFAQPVQEWFDLVLSRYGVRELELSARMAFLATGLPRIHNDPVDRLILATALAHGMILLSPDPFLHQYPGVRVEW